MHLLGYISNHMKNDWTWALMVALTACGGEAFTATGTTTSASNGTGGAGGATTTATSSGGEGGDTSTSSATTASVSSTSTTTSGCVPSVTCEGANVACGPVGDGCGNMLDCGDYERAELCDSFHDPVYNCQCPTPWIYGWTCGPGVGNSEAPWDGDDCITNPEGPEYGWCCKMQV